MSHRAAAWLAWSLWALCVVFVVRPRSPHGSSGGGLGGEVRHDAEVVAGPNPLYRLIEDTLAGTYVQGGTMGTAAHEDVIDPAA